MTRPMCQHCKWRVACRPRQLCAACHENRSIRALYPRKKWTGYAGDFFCASPQLDAEPTTARPGSEEKIAVLTRRVQARLSPWHPGDEPLLAQIVAQRRFPKRLGTKGREKAPLIRKLRRQGCTLQAIAEATGLGKTLVRRILLERG